MKKAVVLAVLGAVVVFGSVFAQEEKTIKGEVIDLSCYAIAGEKGVEHKTCALACLEAGEPAGILEEGTGKVYLVITSDHMTSPSKKMLPYVSKMVEAKGKVNERGGISTVDITEIKEAGTDMSGMSMPKAEMGMPKSGMGMMKDKKKMEGY
ncbi:MAG TPA: hypothetical protein VMD04_05940 [Candidatus Margulisiibacteriota bacterium]|nr:hypothetical protein [Candidatus Margulisiibacteriota bacterium]